MVLVVALASCKKTPEVNLKYVDVERDLVTVGTTTANIQCDYDYIATLKKAYLFYGEGMDEADFTSAEMRVVQNTLYVELMGLKSNTTYNYYYEFHNGFNSMRTALKNFKTEAGNGGGEEPPTPEITLPTVITAVVTEITTNSANGGGEVTDDGGDEVTERGICWSTHANPTLEDSHVAAGSGMGAFSAVMNGLEANTTYHVRAYAINVADTAYGLDKEFVTIGGGSGAPTGAIDGLFSVSPTQKVYFSRGNLQYQASTNTWRFAENQWDFVGSTVAPYSEVGGTVAGSSNHLISEMYNGWIDLFCWGTSGWDCGNVYYRPYDKDGEKEQYGPIGNTSLTGNYANSDWGVHNVISNGGNQAGLWRTLTIEEWVYVIETRSTASTIRYAKAKVNNVNGVILLPDDWSTSCYTLNSTNQADADYTANIISSAQWVTLEQHGAVFFPAAGCRFEIGLGTSVEAIGSQGLYWSASCGDTSINASYLIFYSHIIFSQNLSGARNVGMSVRLVRSV